MNFIFFYNILHMQKLNNEENINQRIDPSILLIGICPHYCGNFKTRSIKFDSFKHCSLSIIKIDL